MKPPFTAVILFTATVLSSCAVDPGNTDRDRLPHGTGPAGWAGQVPQVATDTILESPSGSRLSYQDNHGRYTITLFPNGHYRFVSISQNETVADTTEGRWSWRRAGPGHGELSIGKDIWTLRFKSPDRAEATTTGDVRTYSFSFKRL
jgi:hypothetical protein